MQRFADVGFAVFTDLYLGEFLVEFFIPGNALGVSCGLVAVAFFIRRLQVGFNGGLGNAMLFGLKSRYFRIRLSLK